MQVAIIQTDIAWEDAPRNFATLAPRIADAAGNGARLVVLPEMFAYGFSMASERIAEPHDGPSVEFLATQASRCGVWLCGSYPESRPGDRSSGGQADKPSNTLALVSPAGKIVRYRKLHPFTYAGEHLHYLPGDRLVSTPIDDLRVSLFICYDLRFANVFWAAAEHSDAYIVVANWPKARRQHWRTLLRARAIENQAYVIAANRVGTGGELSYVGDSAIIAPNGDTLTEAFDIETTLSAEIDPQKVAELRRDFPFLRDRRPTATLSAVVV